MASSLEYPKALKLDKLYVALALVIVRHKPAESSMKEYILKIRKFISKSKSLENLYSLKFFDSIAFWKTAYERSEAEQVKLNNTIYELEQRIRGQAAEKKISDASSKTEFTRKRSSALEEISENTGPKKQKRARSCNLEVGKADSVPAEKSDGDQASRLPRQMFDLQRILQKRAPNEKVATEAVIMCKVTENELLGAVQSFKTGLGKSSTAASQERIVSKLCTVIHSAELAFSLVHQALVKVTKKKNDGLSKGRVIYYIVCLFESTMTCLNMICTASPKRDELSQKFVDLLCKMTAPLDVSRHGDQEILEGCLFLLLRRLGNMLALFAFQTHKLPPGSDLTVPKGLEEINRELSPKTAQPEAKCLIIILKNILRTKPSTAAGVLNKKEDFVSDIRERLQKTLVHAVFGSDDALFKGGLECPPTPPSINHEIQRDYRNFPEWFTRELWSLVGWDVLSRTAVHVQSISFK